MPKLVNEFFNLTNCNILALLKTTPIFVIPACPESAGITTGVPILVASAVQRTCQNDEECDYFMEL